MKWFMLILTLSLLLFSIVISEGQNATYNQEESSVEMTSAELQNLIETLAKAQKRRLAKTRRYVPRAPYPYMRHPNSNAPAPNSQPPIATVPNTKNNDQQTYNDQETLNRLAELENQLAKLNILVASINNPNDANRVEQIRRSIMDELAVIKQGQTTPYYPVGVPQNSTPQITINNTFPKDSSNYRNDELALLKFELASLKGKLAQLEQQKLLQQRQPPMQPVAQSPDYSQVELMARLLLLEQAFSNKNQTAQPPTTQEVVIKEVPVIKEVVKEVPVVKEVVKEVPIIKEVIKEVPVVKEEIKEVPVTNEIIKEVPVTREVITYRDIVSIPKPDSDLENIMKSYGKRALYFQNAKFDLNEDSKSIIRDIAEVMRTYGRLDVLINGFTSSTGSPIFNQNLSQFRAEAVKRYLMLQGIHADRIFTEYHGIDYSAQTPELARRVEVMFIVK